MAVPLQQGVLWKRRDVFQNRWRPRWFVLQPGVLTYYLMDHGSTGDIGGSADPVESRDRASSWDSMVSENSVHYDVVPRGTISLVGCSLTETPSKPRHQLYCFAILHPEGGTIHLAARTAEARDAWMEQLQTALSQVAATPAARAHTPIARFASPDLPDPIDLMSPIQISEPPTPPTSNQRLRLEQWSTVDEDRCYQGVPMGQLIRDKLDEYLPFLDNASGFTTFLERPNLQASLRSNLLQTVATLPHPPSQYLALLWDSSRRLGYENNLRRVRRLHSFNAHTAIDYYSYRPIWPTSPREFSVVWHWQVVERGDDSKAIALVGFSCTESNDRQPVEEGHIRGDLNISLYLLEPIGDGTRMTRLLQFDPKVRQALALVILKQQAMLPLAIADYLGTPEAPRELTTATLEEAVAQPANGTSNGVARQLDYNHMDESLAVDDDPPTTQSNAEQPLTPSLETQAVLLLGPVLLYQTGRSMDIPGAHLWFLLCVFLAVRQVTLLSLGPVAKDSPASIGSFTCRLSIDLKGITRFLANKREDREELNRGEAEVEVVHLVGSAVARAYCKERVLKHRRVYIPWLLIDDVFDSSLEPVRVSFSDKATGITTMDRVDTMNVQSLADAMLSSQSTNGDSYGQCLVLSTPESVESEVDVEMAETPSGVTVVAVVGTARLETPRSPLKRRMFGSPAARPVLSLSLTVSGADIVTCRRFADEVHKLLQYPELCDETP